MEEEVYLMEYDEQGNIKAYYPKSQLDRYPTPPTIFTEVNFNEWQFLLQNPLFKYDSVNDRFICEDTTGTEQNNLTLWQKITQRFLS